MCVYIYSVVHFHVIYIYFMLQEHKCVLDSCRALEAEDFDITYLPVQTNGLVDMKVSIPFCPTHPVSANIDTL